LILSKPNFKDEGETIGMVSAGGNLKGEAFLKNIFASFQDGISVMDLQFNILKVNPAVEKMFAHSGSFVGKKCYQIYKESSIPCRPCPASRAILTGKPQHEIIAYRNGENFLGWLEVCSYPLQNKFGDKIEGAINYIRNITQRWQKEEEKDALLIKAQKTFSGTLNAISLLLEERDPFAAGHSRRVAQIACAIAKKIELSNDDIAGLNVIAFLHDIGKINIPKKILCKPGKLNDTHFNILKSHPNIAFNMLKDIDFPWPVADVILQHHERLDGSGYPRGISRGDIMLQSRILAVADVTEAITSPRSYRSALTMEYAMKEITKNRGVLYDSNVVDACLSIHTGPALPGRIFPI
jgi:putative nucleotidyltransferase with HDIG domain/PAS domain S-box-containing protein